MDQLANQIQAQMEAAKQKLLEQQRQQQSNSNNVASSEQGKGTWTWPVPSSHTITSDYGNRSLFGSQEFHGGIDIGAPIGTPIVAVADGVVLYAGPASGYGHWVVILHNNGLMSIYGHMYGNQINVSVGDHVTAGQQIAGVGSDGEATGPHLHFGVANGITNGRMDVLNPWNYLK